METIEKRVMVERAKFEKAVALEKGKLVRESIGLSKGIEKTEAMIKTITSMPEKVTLSDLKKVFDANLNVFTKTDFYNELYSRTAVIDGKTIGFVSNGKLNKRNYNDYTLVERNSDSGEIIREIKGKNSEIKAMALAKLTREVNKDKALLVEVDNMIEKLF